MQAEDWIGWFASAVLIATLARQIVTQLRCHSTEAVSGWLFFGQSLASIGFIVYSVLLQNTVFIVTNSLILLTALVGQGVYWHRARRAAGEGAQSSGSLSGSASSSAGELPSASGSAGSSKVKSSRSGSRMARDTG